MNASEHVAGRTFFNYYIFHPVDAPTEKERWLSLITSIVLGIFAVGMIHLICVATLGKRKISSGPAVKEKDDKSSEVFDKTFRGEDKYLLVRTIKDKAEEGERDFQYQLAMLYLTGDKGVTKNEEKAFLWSYRAAKQNHLKAQYILAAMYHGGKGTEINLEKAQKWYLRAAEGGHRVAQYQIAVMYMEGIGVLERSEEEGKRWYHESAVKGYVKAQVNLGAYYAQIRSFEKAIFWLEKAVEQGSQRAAKNLAVVKEAQQKELDQL